MKDVFLKYFFDLVKINTQSSEESVTRPSTKGQLNGLNYIKKELENLGVSSSFISNGLLLAKINGSSETVGFMAHIDTTPEVSGSGVIPAIKIQDKTNREIVYAKSDTLLGADDKAGCAIMLTLANIISKTKNINFPSIELLFTTDEEIGGGLADLDISKLNSKFFLTLDGTDEEVLEAECFNAGKVLLTATGNCCHLGYAKDGGLKNASLALCDFVNKIPKNEMPETTSKKQGYYCIDTISGDITTASCTCFLRDFDYKNLQNRFSNVEKWAKEVAVSTGVKIDIQKTYQYRNMADFISDDSKYIKKLFESSKKNGVDLKNAFIRGGTDGAALSQKGIPCPNLFTGASKIHSQDEILYIDLALKCINICLDFIKGLN